MACSLEQQAMHTVTHWTRNDKISSFPLDLMEIIAAYFNLILTWSATKHGDGVTFIEENKIKIDGSLHSEQPYILCCTNECISFSRFDIFCWELIFHKKCADSLPGFVEVNPDTMDIINPNVDNALYQSAPFEIGGTCLNLHHGDTMWICNGENTVKKKQDSITIPSPLTDGAKIGFRANFRNDTMEVFYMGINQGVVWYNIPKHFAIVTATCLGVDEVEIVFRKDQFNDTA